jgi:alanine racemase
MLREEHPAVEIVKTFCPLERIGDPEEVAALVHFLASEDTRYITGVAIPIDGGLVAGIGFPVMRKVIGEGRTGRGRRGTEMLGRRPTEAVIDLSALRANYAQARARGGDREVIAVVKADAYGHGAVDVSRTLADAGCRRFAVVTVQEGAVLRDAGIEQPSLVIGGVHDADEACEAAARALTPVVHGSESLPWIAAAAEAVARAPLPVQVEVDTGMRRMGVAPEEAVALLERVAKEPALVLDGVYTHLACADEPDLTPSVAQLAMFREILAEARRRGVDPGTIHFANSAGLLAGAPLCEALPDATAVRPGLMLYGVQPAPHLEVDLAPVMTLRTRVVALRNLPAGEACGYNATYRASRDTRLATLPIGYADGVLVSVSNAGCVLIAGQRYRIVGRVSMDSIIIDVGDAPVALGDVAVLFGRADGEVLPVEEAAAAAGTISHELLMRVGARVPRVVID